MKVMSSVKPICKYCRVVSRNKTVFIICKILKHKQRQG